LRQLRGEQRLAGVAAHGDLRSRSDGKRQGEDQPPSCSLYGCGARYSKYNGCQCNFHCVGFGNCCSDYMTLCKAPPAPAPPTPAPAPAHIAGEDPNCQTAVEGETECYRDVHWAKNRGIWEKPPGTYGELTHEDTFREWQFWFWQNGFGACKIPCGMVAPPTPAPVPQHVDGEDPDCHTAVEGDAKCYKDIMWARRHGIREKPAGTYGDLTQDSTMQEWQYWFFKNGAGGCTIPCGMKPGPNDPHTILTRTTQGVPPPATPLQYNGMAWPTMKIRGTELSHFFAVGDWGGLAGQLPHNSQIIQYTGGQTPGPHTMGRYRTDAHYHTLTCTTPEMSDCFATLGKACTGWEVLTGEKCCKASCGWNAAVDVPAQHLVANQMKKRAALSNPEYILNVGDSFYWGGLFGECGGTPMTRVNDIVQTQFKWIFEDIYNGPGLDGKPWLSTLGNHDWGGRQFNAAWDQMIAYTWTSNRWILPAAYWMQRIEYVDQNFSVDIFMIDSNIEDALENVTSNPEHNICGALHNPVGASCSSVGAIPSIKGCHDWFEELWTNGSEWVTQQLADSTADWQILVTHFPCGHKAGFYRMLHQKYGLDLMVTGHVHYQMMYWDPHRLGGMTCFITGGGGGITSENTVDMLSGRDHQYGFYDLTISQTQIGIESINWNGTTIGLWTVHPTMGTDTLAARNAPCEPPTPGDRCDKAISWAIRDGLYAHPSWFPGLTRQSNRTEFQKVFFDEHRNNCGKPCVDE